MKNITKYIALILAVLLMASALSLSLASCAGGDNNDNGDDNGGDNGNTPGGGNEPEEPVGTPYTLTVKDNNNAPVEGAVVKLTVNGTSVRQATTNAEGDATIYVTEDNVIVVFADLVSVPEGYAMIAAATSVDLKKETSVKFTVNALEKVKYTAKVVDQNGDAVVGAMLHLCYGVICQRPQVTDEQGEISEQFYDTGETVTVTASFDSLPDGYTMPAVYKDIPFDAGETEIVLVVTKN